MTNCRWQIWSVSSRVAALFHHHSRCSYWTLFVRRSTDHIVRALRSCTIFMNVKICTCDLLLCLFQHSKMIFRAGIKVNVLLLHRLKMWPVHCPAPALFLCIILLHLSLQCVYLVPRQRTLWHHLLYITLRSQSISAPQKKALSAERWDRRQCNTDVFWLNCVWLATKLASFLCQDVFF